MSLAPRIDKLENNLIINGNFDFWQRGTSATFNNGNAGYLADRFKSSNGGSSSKGFSIQQSSDVPSVTTSGMASSYSSLATVTTLLSPFAAADYVEPFLQFIEGYNYSSVHGKNICLSFWFKASIVGTYSISVKNGNNDRSYVTTFSIATANTWTYISTVIPTDTVGIWFLTNNIGLVVDIAAYSGSTYKTSTLNQWQNGNYIAANSATNWMNTLGATIQVAQVRVAQSDKALDSSTYQRAGRNIQEELLLCQRYYEKSYNLDVIPGTATVVGTFGFQTSSTTIEFAVEFKVIKRLAPTITFYAGNGTINALSGSCNDTTVLSLPDVTTSSMTNFYLGFSGPWARGGHFTADAEL